MTVSDCWYLWWLDMDIVMVDFRPILCTVYLLKCNLIVYSSNQIYVYNKLTRATK